MDALCFDPLTTIMPLENAIIQPSPPSAPTPEPVPPSPMDLDDAGGIDESIPPGVALWSNVGADPFDVAPTPYVVEPGGGEDHDRRQRQDSSSLDSDSDSDSDSNSNSDSDNHKEEQVHLPSPAPTIDDMINVFPFAKPPEQDYIWKMISRRLGDISVTEFIDDLINDHTPLANNSEVEAASRRYYETEPMETPPRESGLTFAYQYPREDILFLQQRLRGWTNVVPPPIPIVILKPTDYIAPACIRQGGSGWIFAMPNETAIWGTVLERGIDMSFRPIAHELVDGRSQPVAVSTVGQLTFTAEDIVASKFAVNLFGELPNQAHEKPVVEYLGAFLLQHVSKLNMAQSVWDDIPDDIKDYVYDQAPHLFEGFRPFEKVPRVPFVKLLYVKLDKNLVGCADRATLRKKARKAWKRIDRKRMEECKKFGEEDPGNVADEEDSSDSTDFEDGM